MMTRLVRLMARPCRKCRLKCRPQGPGAPCGLSAENPLTRRRLWAAAGGGWTWAGFAGQIPRHFYEGFVMLGWFQALMPREDRFFALFNRHATVLVDGALALRMVLQGGDNVPASCRAVMNFEQQADLITRDVLLLT